MSFLWADRRFALGKRWEAEQDGQPALAEMWRATQLAASTDALPALFPYRARLIATGYYLGLSDLAGAYPDEFYNFGFSHDEALQIINALPDEYKPAAIYGDDAPLC